MGTSSDLDVFRKQRQFSYWFFKNNFYLGGGSIKVGLELSLRRSLSNPC